MPESIPSPAVLTLSHVVVTGRDTPRLRADLAIPQGVTAIIGPSGAGKTTLLDACAGFVTPAEGQVTRPPDGQQLPCFWSPAEGGLWPHRSVREHLSLVSHREASHLDRLLADFDLLELAHVRPAGLSQGQQARLGIARALAAEPVVLLLDEPMVHVEPARAPAWFATLIERVRATGTSLVFSTHDPSQVLSAADHVVCLDRGEVTFAGPVDGLYDDPPTEPLANALGPTNWIEGDGDVFFPVNGRRSVRPERVEVRQDDAGSFVLEASRHEGATSTSVLRHATSQATRTVHHRGRAPARGARVVLHVLLVLFCCTLVGCVTEEDNLDMRATRHLQLPAFGARIPRPRGVTSLRDGRVLVLDNAGRVLVYDAKMQVEATWTMPEYDVGRPEGACLLLDGRIAVADTHYSRVVFFDSKGKFTGTFGSRGKGRGQFLFPIKVTQDPSGFLYVAEYGANDRIQKFTAEGVWVASFGSFGNGPEQFQRPSGLVWHGGEVFVADAVNHRIQVFTDKGQFVRTLSGPEGRFQLRMPYDLSIDSKGDLYVCEYGAGRVSRFTRAGQLVGRIGKVGNDLGHLATPWGLACTSDGRIVVADTGNRRLVEWSL